MSTSFEHVNSYDAAAADVHAMLLDPAFREEVCVSQRALEHTVTVTPGAAGTTVEIRRSQSMEGAPAVATKVVGSAVTVVQRETWTSPVTADFAMEIPGKPGHLRGTIRLEETADGGCREVFRGEVKVKVPLVAGKLESLIEDVLARGLRREGRVGVAWLADRAG